MVKKYYAVKNGRQPGIYTSWPECQRQVSGYPGAVYKGFTSRMAAQEWLHQSHTSKRRPSEQLQLQLTMPSRQSRPAIHLYTDGGSRNHGNKRGQHVKANDKAAWAYLIVYHGHHQTGTGGEYGATNNKMEITALIQALRYLLAHRLNNQPISATLDSHYVLDPIVKGWVYGWRHRGWRTASGKPVANQAEWQTLLTLLPRFAHLTFDWTKGHANNQGNNLVDALLNTTMDKMEGTRTKNENWN